MPNHVRLTRPSKPDLRRIQAHLDALGPGSTLLAYWQAGRALNDVLGTRAAYGTEGLERLQRRLDLSAPMLHQLRRMARVWDRADVRAAERAGISLRESALLVGLDVLAARLEPTEARKLKSERRRLVRRIGRSRPSYWQVGTAIRVLRARYDREAGRHTRAKRLRMSRNGITRQVVDLRRRLRSLEPLLDPPARKALRRESARIRRAAQVIGQILAGARSPRPGCS